ncbi:MAG: HlyD family type I secretion periplasmic adaptor subunit [Victivallaceae bacterium]|nr:HlyD family type I secretion periplasmic adaptor subunit [Victivallaceae bacterium]
MKKDAPNNDAIAFLPDPLEIKYEKLPWYARNGIWWILLIFTLAVAWAIIGEVDVIVIAPGKLVSNRNVTMKPLERSVIKTVHVREGQTVKKGQPLVTFDPELTQADVDRLASEINSLTAEFERLGAEFQGKEYKPANANHNYAAWQLAIFKQRQSYYNVRMRYFEESLKRVDVSIKSTQESLAKQEEILKVMREMEAMFIKLRDQKAGSAKEALDVAVNRMQTESQVQQLRNSLVAQEHEKLSTMAERNSFVEGWLNSISEDLVKIRRELVSNKMQYEKAEQLMSYIELRAPCDAVVHEIAAFAIGSAVREGEAVITLVPLDSDIELEAELSPQDIGKVHPYSEARVKLGAFQFQRYGTLDGVVRTISENTFNRREQGEAAPGSYYRVNLTLSGSLRNTEKNFRLIPGMEATAEIKVGQRRLIEYILYPIIKGLDESFREP